MDYKEFQNRVDHGTQMFDSGNMQAALEIFTGLINSDISDLDKSSMCLNIAVIYDKLGNLQQCLEWYARAIQLEKAHSDLKPRNTWQTILSKSIDHAIA
jgi:Tfp pilus assembly protein PilF